MGGIKSLATNLAFILALQAVVFTIVIGQDYDLFASKTTYSRARGFFEEIDAVHWPKSFDKDSLEEKHRNFVRNGCEPQVFYFIGRHSARFADGNEIDQYNKDLTELIGKLDLNNQNLEKFLSWESKMQAKQDNLITDLGGREEQDIARQFKRIYPEFFDVQTADVEIGVTNKIRTAQTGAQFLREVNGLNLPGCDESSVPTNDVDQPAYDVIKILEAPCYLNMLDDHRKESLSFHEECKKIRGEGKIKDSRIDRVKASALKRPIANRVARKLGLDNNGDNQPVTPKVLDSIFDMCRFENALKNSSIWCNVFEKRDIEALEYIDDVNSYIKSAYGPEANPRQSCPVVKNLMEAMHNMTHMAPDSSTKKKSYFFFSHADPMKKLLAAFGMFHDDDIISEKRIAEFEKDLKVPKNRSWRTSVITPFSANLAFILYRCQKSPAEQVTFKILTTVTERPVKLGGCEDTVCSSESFFNTYGSMLKCDLKQICGGQS